MRLAWPSLRELWLRNLTATDFLLLIITPIALPAMAV